VEKVVKLELRCGQEQLSVEIPDASDRSRVIVGGRELPCDWARLPDGRYSLILANRVYDLSVDLDSDSCLVDGRSGAHQFQIIDPRRLRRHRPLDDGQAGLQRINAEMPGKVVRLLVKAGDQVRFDQGLLVLEAMKMQNEIRAPKSGVVKEVGVQDGRAVNTGDFLISLE
jgi:acetyl/propionyl-CoA carboxylase alpha subunit